MIAYKKIDLLVQLILFLLTIVLMLSSRFEIGIGSLMLLGGVQLTSAITHFFLKPRLWNTVQRVIYYFLATGCLLILFLIYMEFFEDPISILIYMVFITGGVALMYMLICWNEMKKRRS